MSPIIQTYVTAIQNITRDNSYQASSFRLNFLIGTQICLANEYVDELHLNPDNVNVRTQLDLLKADIKLAELQLHTLISNG